ncbi:hypothetical protein ACX3VT_05675 [Aerococcus sanguinicola]|nr:MULTISPECIES: hypothetical protein [unclassified Aerococcus]MDK6233984.1 hypothetical protein [Aerococcus sp. UMB10185]MDK6856672.1 hypothetical protein [Aerococcus sp. UMB7533]MDK8502731.1 hypothetical protein [Aerococcus sp. UMB1112A]
MNLIVSHEQASEANLWIVGVSHTSRLSLARRETLAQAGAMAL